MLTIREKLTYLTYPKKKKNETNMIEIGPLLMKTVDEVI